MKLQIIITYLLLTIASFDSYNKFTLYEQIYYSLFLSLILIFLKEKKIIVLIHFIYILLIISYSLICENHFLLLSGMIASVLYLFSRYINRSCYFYDLQLPKKLQHKDLPFFKGNIITISGYLLYFYNFIITYYKLSNGTITNKWICGVHKSIAILIFGIMGYEYYYQIMKQSKKKSLILIPKVSEYLNNFI